MGCTLISTAHFAFMCTFFRSVILSPYWMTKHKEIIMGYKSIIVFDMDHLNLIIENPVQFATNLKNAMLSMSSYKEGTVQVFGDHCTATVASVIHVCHTDETPILKFPDFHAETVELKDLETF